MATEDDIRQVISRIERAWKSRQFEGLEQCFHKDAVIVGPGYVEYGSGRNKCAESYREFALNAQVLAYSEDGHALRVWENTAIYTYNWQMSYRREQGSKSESGTDQLILERTEGGWQVVWRYIHFQPSEPG